MKRFKTLDEIKNELLDMQKNKDKITQDQVDTMIEHLELGDDDYEKLIEWFDSNKIKVQDDSLDELEESAPENEEELVEVSEEDDDYRDDYFTGDDDDEPFDESLNTVDLSSYVNQAINISNIRINDPVKIYLKEIGRVNLLKSEDEPEIARRIEDGLKAVELLEHMYGETFPSKSLEEIEELGIEGIEVQLKEQDRKSVV